MFGWLKKRFARPDMEARWTVSLEPNQVRVADDMGRVIAVAKDAIAGVAIETNDAGPWGADVWWLLSDHDGQLLCRFPQGATGEAIVTDHLMGLPGFDYEQMVKAMASTAIAVFPVWARGS